MMDAMGSIYVTGCGDHVDRFPCYAMQYLSIARSAEKAFRQRRALPKCRQAGSGKRSRGARCRLFHIR